MRAIIYGAGNNFIYSCFYIEKKYEIVGLADNSKEKQGEELFGYKVKYLHEYDELEYDVIILTPNTASDIKNNLILQGIDEKKVIYLEDILSVTYENNHINIAILFYGGLGDFIIGKNWLYFLNLKYGLKNNANISIYFSRNAVDTAKSIFGDCEWISDIREIDINNSMLIGNKFDLVMRFSIFPYVQYMNSEKLFVLNQSLYEYAMKVREFGWKYYVEGFFSSPLFYKTVNKLFKQYPERKYHTHCDVLGNLGVSDEYLCDIEINTDEIKYLSKIGLEKKQFITIDTGLNDEYLRKTNSRSWRFSKWKKLGILLKEKFPEIKIVQIGLSIRNNDNIPVDVNLNGRTNLEQAKVLLKNALLHIDYDGGLVHLRHVLRGGTSIVLMGPSDVKVHNYPENIAIQARNCITACEWQGKEWLVSCKKGFKYPECMELITPEMVIEKIERYLKQ